MFRTFVPLLLLIVLGLCAQPVQAALVLEISELGPAQAVHAAEGNTAVGQLNNAATVFSGGGSTQIITATSNASQISQQWVVGQSGSTAARYNVVSGNTELFTVVPFQSTAADITNAGTALVNAQAGPGSNLVAHWNAGGGFSQVLPSLQNSLGRGLQETGDGVVFDLNDNSAKFFSSGNFSVVTLSLGDYDPSAGFEGDYTAGALDTSDPQAAFHKLGDASPTVLPKLSPSDQFGTVNDLNEFGQMVGQWDGVPFLYDDQTGDMVNLSLLPQTGDVFADINIPSAISDNGSFFGIGQFEVSPGVFEDRLYQGRVVMVAVPEPASVLTFGLLSGLLAVRRISRQKR